MMRDLLLTAVVALTALLPWRGPDDVAGTWKVVMEGEKRPIEGTLVIGRKDHDLTARWSTIDEWTLTGRIEGDRFALESESRPVPATNGAKQGTISARWTFRGVLKDGTLAGTASIAFGDSEPRLRKWTATRQPSS